MTWRHSNGSDVIAIFQAGTPVEVAALGDGPGWDTPRQVVSVDGGRAMLAGGQFFFADTPVTWRTA